MNLLWSGGHLCLQGLTLDDEPVEAGSRSSVLSFVELVPLKMLSCVSHAKISVKSQFEQK